jgi:soluble P-type ATPase
MQRWEYCAIVRVSATSGGRLVASTERTVHYFTDHHVKIVKVNADDPDALGLSISDLGVQGWEMVGCGNTGGESHTVYFKRPL